jgi:hypothetical protein
MKYPCQFQMPNPNKSLNVAVKSQSGCSFNVVAMLHLHGICNRDVQIPGARTPRLLNFVPWRVM